jgi:hypothetical protein
MKIVPIEPTEAMISELMHEWDSVGATSMYDNYTAMLEAAPESDHIIVSRAEYDALKVDAERYRFLEDMFLSRINDDEIFSLQYATCDLHFTCDDTEDNKTVILRKHLDEAIDKARGSK